MPATTTPAKKHQERWQEIASDPLLGELPYKVETNKRGQIVLSPHTTRHSRKQKRVMKKLDNLLESREAFQEWPIATAGGTKQADVIWSSETRLAEMEATGEPPTLAPEICVEVMSESNDWEEMEEKIALYREADDIVQLNVRVRKKVRKALGKLKLEREENIEDLVDEALRDYIGGMPKLMCHSIFSVFENETNCMYVGIYS